MHRVFGKKKKEEPGPSLTDAGGRVDGRVAALDAKIKGLDQELIRYKGALKKAKGSSATSIKRRAMETLKRKKMYEQQRDQLAGQQFNIEQASFAMDSIKDTQDTVSAMKAASKQACACMKKEFKKISIGEVEDMTDDLADMMEDMNEVNEALGRSYDVGEEIDEDDLDAELACLDDELEALEGLEEEESTPAYMMPSVSMPMEPTTVPEANANVDDFGLPAAPVAAQPGQVQTGVNI
ncbi:unnamed protein product [Chrysoparadoxa australica]